MSASNSKALVFPTIVPCFSVLEPLFRNGAQGFSRILRGSHVCGRDVIGRKIAADDPPTDPLRSSHALNCPYRHVWSNVPCRPIADTAVLNLLGAKVFRDDCSLGFAPALLDIRIIVVWLIHD